MADEETMGQRLKRLGESKGWSFGDAAKQFRTSRTAVWKWESGDTRDIKYRTLELVAKAYGTDIPYIMWGPDRSPDASSSRSPPTDRSGRFRKL